MWAVEDHVFDSVGTTGVMQVARAECSGETVQVELKHPCPVSAYVMWYVQGTIVVVLFFHLIFGKKPTGPRGLVG